MAIHGERDVSVNVTSAFAALPVTLSATPPAGAALPVESEALLVVGGDEARRQLHYGDPRHGCRPDEETVLAGTGAVCAPKVAARFANATHAPGDGAPPVPECHVGGAAPHRKNGCPTDAAVSARSRAFPVCLAKSPHGEADPYTNGDFHCLLVCPCAAHHAADCGAEAHAHCPHGARCQRGELRNRAQGICTFEDA